MFWNGCPISWRSKLHPFVSTNINHAEYCAGATCAKECSYIRNISSEIGIEVSPATLHYESRSYWYLLKNTSSRSN